MTSSKTQWFVVPWFQGKTLASIHPDDQQLLRSTPQSSLLFRALRKEPPYLVLDYYGDQLRVEQAKCDEVSTPVIAVGSKVLLSDGREGIVGSVCWHFERALPFYHLAINGKKKSKRYWGADLRLVDLEEP